MNSKNNDNKGNVVGEDVYIFSKNLMFKLIVSGCIVLLLGFACQVSLSPRIEQMVASEIDKNKKCPIYYDDVSFSPMTLSLKMKDIRVSASCWGGGGGVLELKEVRVGPGLPGIWPLGLKSNVTLKGEDFLVGLSFLWGFKRVLYVRKNSRLSSNLINTIVGQGDILTGNIFLGGNVELQGSNIKTAQLVLQSKHFNLLSKTIRAGPLPFTLPALRIAPIVLKGGLAGKKIEIDSLRLGDAEEGPLFADFKGTVDLNKRLNRVENVDIQGELKVSDELLEGPLAVLKLLWNIGKRPMRNGVYQIKFSGPFPKALTSPEFVP